MESFDKFVKQQRDEGGFSLNGFAERLGVSWITVWRWENNKSSPPESVLEFWKDKILNIRENVK